MNNAGFLPFPRILDGRIARAKLKKDLIQRIAELRKISGSVPKLAIIQVGSRSDSAAYISGKKQFAAEIGALEQHINFPETVSADDIFAKISELNDDRDMHGIIVQLPLPAALAEAKDRIMNAVDQKKDVDGLTEASIAAWSEGKPGAMYPATARGISELLAYYHIPVAGKKVTVVGRSVLVGRPTAAICAAAGAEVTVAHSKTEDLVAATKSADILIVAAGKPGLITPDHVHAGQTVIDVGTTPVSDSTVPGGARIAGDVDFDRVSAVLGTSGAITPVPGGVGQMTVLALFENLIDAWYNQHISA
ncbi:MAG: hypothetical protein JWO73_405 [Candidatus Taylorbacteria bacterium]|nr:hypothetical protein [Candidatus Taylorbacteria bacterium]